MIYIDGALIRDFYIFEKDHVSAVKESASSRFSFTLQNLCLQTLEQPLLQLEANIDQIESENAVFPWRCNSVFLKDVLFHTIELGTLFLSRELCPENQEPRDAFFDMLVADFQVTNKPRINAHCSVLEAIQFYEDSNLTLNQIRAELINFCVADVKSALCSLAGHEFNKIQEYREALSSIELQEQKFLLKEKAKIALEFLELKTQQQTPSGTTLLFEGERMEKLFQHLSGVVLETPIKEQLEIWPDFLNICILPSLQKYVTSNALLGLGEIDDLMLNQAKSSFCAQLRHMKREFEFFEKDGESATCKWLNERYFLSNLNVESILANPALVVLEERCVFTEELCGLFEEAELFA